MRRQDQLKPEDEIAELLHDIRAAQRLRDVLGEASADRALLQRTIDRLDARVLSLLADPQRGESRP